MVLRISAICRTLVHIRRFCGSVVRQRIADSHIVLLFEAWMLFVLVGSCGQDVLEVAIVVLLDCCVLVFLFSLGFRVFEFLTS